MLKLNYEYIISVHLRPGQFIEFYRIKRIHGRVRSLRNKEQCIANASEEGFHAAQGPLQGVGAQEPNCVICELYNNDTLFRILHYPKSNVIIIAVLRRDRIFQGTSVNASPDACQNMQSCIL